MVRDFFCAGEQAGDEDSRPSSPKQNRAARASPSNSILADRSIRATLTRTSAGDSLAQLERDVNCNCDFGIAPVIQVVTVIDVVNVDVVGFVPGARPVFRPGINQTEPEAHVLEPWISIDNDDWISMNAEAMCAAKVGAEAVFGNMISAVTAAFAPTAMFTLPMPCAVILPNVARPRVSFGFTPAYLAKVFRPMRALIVRLRPFGPALVCALLVRSLFGPPLRSIRLMPVRAFRGAPMFLLMLVAAFFL